LVAIYYAVHYEWLTVVFSSSQSFLSPSTSSSFRLHDLSELSNSHKKSDIFVGEYHNLKQNHI